MQALGSSWLIRLRTVLVVGLLFSAGSASAAPCQAGACISAGPVLVAVDTKQSLLLNALLGGLLGTSVNLTVLDWNAIGQSNINVLEYLQALQLNTGLSSTNDVLNTQLSVLELIQAAADVAQADGNTAAVTALNALLNLPGLVTTVRLGDLLKLTFPVGALASADINLIDLVTGVVELYNYKNVVTTPAPVTLNTSSLASLGLGGLANVELYLQVVEPPVFICGPAGTEFYTAAIRIELNLNLGNLSLDTSALTQALSVLGTVSTSLNLTNLSLYADVARATGTLGVIDALAQTVTLTGRPGVVDLYLGSVPDALFYNRTRAINPATDLDFGTVGSLSILIKDPIFGATLLNVTNNVQLKSAAEGAANATPDTVTVGGPFPRVVTFNSSSVSVANLIATLVASLEIRVEGTLGPLVNPLLNTVVLPLLKPLVANAVAPLLGSVLGGLVDPLLELLGIKIGQAVIKVNGIGGIGEDCVNLALNKTVRNVSRNETTFVVANAAQPGDELEYCLDYANSGPFAAQNVVLRDPLSANLTPLLNVTAYGGQALQLNGVTNLSAAAGDDQGEWQDRNLTVRVGTVPRQSTGKLCFRAVMN